ncbi:transglycosylase SLT domain-containing protein [Granulosicoccaceae sp. 1_MG-2023]|nr:transglycosylase SLT domain-containing protein [Granulosicoccaceae sp. 1_MG-2023]
MGRHALLLIIVAGALSGCITTPPATHDDLCAIFEEKRGWYKAAIRAEKRWQVPPPVSMAFIRQESSFSHDARAPRKYAFFGLIPWGYQSSAYGYSQALDGTWQQFRDETKQPRASRRDFAAAIDFVGWYIDMSHRQLGIGRSNAYHQYISYHEGPAGYARGAWKNKPALLQTASRVAANAKTYTIQYQSCKESLSRGFWYRLFH